MRTILLNLAIAFGLLACVTSNNINARAKSSIDIRSTKSSCPAGSERTFDMVENFLINPRLSDARSETGTSGLSASQIQLVQDESVCQQLNSEFSEFTDEYVITYYKTGNFYFATQIIKQPDNVNEVTSGLMMIYVLDSNLNFIKGYSG